MLAEDNYLLREGMSRLIEAQPELELAAACEDFDSLVAAIDAHGPGVVLTDIRMPPGDERRHPGGQAPAQDRPEPGVVVLSQYADPQYALQFLEHGSRGRGYLLKERLSDIDQLLAAIREVAKGGSVIDPKVIDALVAARSKAPSALRDLTIRESEVLSEMAQGKNNAAIAGSLPSPSGRSRSTSTRCSPNSGSPRSVT